MRCLQRILCACRSNLNLAWDWWTLPLTAVERVANIISIHWMAVPEKNANHKGKSKALYLTYHNLHLSVSTPLCPFHFSEASDIMKSIGEAIHFLHTINIAHRDIKVTPHCIYLRQHLQQWTVKCALMRRFCLQLHTPCTSDTPDLMPSTTTGRKQEI